MFHDHKRENNLFNFVFEGWQDAGGRGELWFGLKNYDVFCTKKISWGLEQKSKQMSLRNRFLTVETSS